MTPVGGGAWAVALTRRRGLPWEMLPPPSFVRGYLLRGSLLWVAIHFGAGFVVAAAGGDDPVLAVSTLALSWIATLFLLGAVFVASSIDDRVRRDDVFLANLGVAPSTAAGISTAAALVLEVALQAAAGLA